MCKTRPVNRKHLILAGLLVAVGLLILQSGAGLLVMLTSVSGLAALLWWFTRRPRPESEEPCSSVSCCHYLGDHEEEHQEQPQPCDSDNPKTLS